MTEVASPTAVLTDGHASGFARSVSRTESYEIGGCRLELMCDPHVFRPTLTTSVLTTQVLAEGIEGVTALDLGCGIGPISIVLAKSGARHVYSVDLMPRACELVQTNATLNGVADRITALHGDLFKPVEGKVFDLIVDDVSGVAASVARLSHWFPEQVPLGGSDGSVLAVSMLKDAEDYLAPGGRLFFPVLSLSNRRRILDTAQEIFGDRVRCLVTKHVPFSPELKANLPTLLELRDLGVIQFEQVRSRCFWTIEVYKATRAD